MKYTEMPPFIRQMVDPKSFSELMTQQDDDPAPEPVQLRKGQRLELPLMYTVARSSAPRSRPVANGFVRRLATKCWATLASVRSNSK